MISKLIIAILLTLMPLTELRLGLPVAMSYAKDSWPLLFFVFIIIVAINILLVFAIFWFLDVLHELFMNFKIYKKLFGVALRRIQKKMDKFEKSYSKSEFWALVFFVGIPLPMTGAWSGCLLSWALGIERKKSVVAISLGILIAGILIFLGSLGFFELFF